jgi:chaperone required for assembly of F1-ATPase
MANPPDNRPNRFYKAAAAAPSEAGFAVMLDGRTLRTPRQARLILPTGSLAALVAAEWEAQVEVIDLAHMPATRLAFTAADRVSQARPETVREVVNFAASDLLCYFAEAPQVLVRRQTDQWGPILAWAEQDLGLIFIRADGIIHKPQPEATLHRLSDLVNASDDFTLAGLAFAASLFGSAILATALWRGRLDGDVAFELSRLDEAFQEQQWGVDDEAAVRTAHRRAEAAMLDRWFQALR